MNSLISTDQQENQYTDNTLEFIELIQSLPQDKLHVILELLQNMIPTPGIENTNTDSTNLDSTNLYNEYISLHHQVQKEMMEKRKKLDKAWGKLSQTQKEKASQLLNF